MEQAPMRSMSLLQAGQVERWINQRTWGRVKNLRVERAGNRVVIHGRAGSYYHKQLALAAALESVDAETLVFDVDVVPSRLLVHLSLLGIYLNANTPSQVNCLTGLRPDGCSRSRSSVGKLLGSPGRPIATIASTA